MSQIAYNIMHTPKSQGRFSSRINSFLGVVVANRILFINYTEKTGAPFCFQRISRESGELYAIRFARLGSVGEVRDYLKVELYTYVMPTKEKIIVIMSIILFLSGQSRILNKLILWAKPTSLTSFTSRRRYPQIWISSRTARLVSYTRLIKRASIMEILCGRTLSTPAGPHFLTNCGFSLTIASARNNSYLRPILWIFSSEDAFLPLPDKTQPKGAPVNSAPILTWRCGLSKKADGCSRTE